MTTEEIWEKTLQDIKTEVSMGNFTSFFKTSEVIEIQDSTVKIATLSTVVADFLDKKFSSLLKETMSKYTPTPVTTLEFATKTVKKQVKEKLPQDQFDFTEKKEVMPSMGHIPRVRKDFTFENLAVSDSNQLAYVSAQTVANNLGRSYNPLFVYGPTGVGKTHIMHAIANQAYQKDSSLTIIYCTSEDFINRVVDAIRNNNTSAMKRYFRSANLLIIDDIQFISGKEKVQEELFHTFNAIIDAGGQIVLTSDKPPQEIKKLEARLSSRFAGGLTIDIQEPDFAMRTAIIMKKAEKFGYDIDIEIAKAIAEKEQDVRSLEGALLRVMTEAQTRQVSAEKILASNILKDAKPIGFRLHSDDIIKSTCEYYDVKPTQLKGPKRDAALVKARQVTMFLLKQELGTTLVEIGNLLGGRDHTTIMHGIEKVENLLKNSAELNEEILGITRNLRG